MRCQKTTSLILFALLNGCTGAVGGSSDSPGGGGPGTGGVGGTGVDPVVEPEVDLPDPGRVTLRRLNRAEYNNTVQNLLATKQRPADAFPPDDRGQGFDNIGEVLTLSPVQISMYQQAAESLVGEALKADNTTARALILICDLAAQGEPCAESILRTFARKAWRRPPTDAEVKSLMTLVTLARDNGDTSEVGIGLGLRAVLQSPHFIFLVEIDQDPGSPKAHRLTTHELAARLSYLMWSSLPDDDLARAADDRSLAEEATLTAQVARMLGSPKSFALVDNFAAQWLHTRNLETVFPSPYTFTTFDMALRVAFRGETELMFREMLLGKLPVNQMLTANFTFANDRLAKHYGMKPVGSATHRRVTIPADVPRRGLLTHGSMLTVTSHRTQTSPVLRGKWVLEQILCKEVPPPPANVMTDLPPESQPTATLRQRLEAHLSNDGCKSCHSIMDPIGFGLENYDGVGQYRTQDAGFDLDTSGTLPGGRKFTGPMELAALIAEDPDVVRCVAKQLYTYALGRPVESDSVVDGPVLDDITARLQAGGYKMEDLFKLIVTSAPFRNRRGEAPPGGLAQ